LPVTQAANRRFGSEGLTAQFRATPRPSLVPVWLWDLPCIAALPYCPVHHHQVRVLPNSPCCSRRTDKSTPVVYARRNPHASPFHRLVRDHTSAGSVRRFGESERVYPEIREKSKMTCLEGRNLVLTSYLLIVRQ
jgi:hypothetical protein